MTATQVFLRFLKENGYYKKTIPYIFLLANFYNVKKKSFGKVREMCGDTTSIVDNILKNRHSSLSHIVFLLGYYTDMFKGYNRWEAINSMASEFNKFLKTNVKGNYRKCMIEDTMPEIDVFGGRNGYHSLNFTYKDDTCNQH